MSVEASKNGKQQGLPKGAAPVCIETKLAANGGINPVILPNTGCISCTGNGKIEA